MNSSSEYLLQLIQLAHDSPSSPYHQPENFTLPDVTNPSYRVENDGERLFIVSVFSMVLAGLVVVVRLMTKALSTTAGLDLSDLVMSLASAVATGLTILNCKAVTTPDHGAGLHTYDITVTQYDNVLKVFFISQIIYMIAAFLVKLSILMFIHRLVASSTRPLKRTVMACFVFLCLFSFIIFFILIFRCQPVSAYWNIERQALGAKCEDPPALYYAIGCGYIITDIALIILPSFLVWNLSLPTRQRLGLILLFCTGTFSCIAVVLRLSSLAKAMEFDFSWRVLDMFMWAQLEVTTAIIAASIPALNALIMKGLRSDDFKGFLHFLSPPPPPTTVNGFSIYSRSMSLPDNTFAHTEFPRSSNSELHQKSRALSLPENLTGSSARGKFTQRLDVIRGGSDDELKEEYEMRTRRLV